MTIRTSVLSLAFLHSTAVAQERLSLESQVRALEQQLEHQRTQMEAQQAALAAQRAELEALKRALAPDGELQEHRGRGSSLAVSAQGPVVLPTAPVGEEPDLPTTAERVQAVPEGMGVLTPPGDLVVEPSVEFTLSSTNRLVFRGIELIPGIQIGVIEASDADRETISASATVRSGITKRLEFEARIPVIRRSDRIEFVQQREGTIVRELNLKETALGDVEFAARYQLTRPTGERPILVASLRVKSDLGKGPFEIPFDEFGVATGLATGSGFWAVQPGLSFLLPSDPTVIFGGIGYLYHVPKEIDRAIGDVFVGRVDPGDGINANLGFGFALNPRFSYSLGYRHTYILPTTSEIGESEQRSNSAHVGSLNLGLSYRISPRQALNISFDFGVTEDAPDVGISVRLPFRVEGPLF